MIRHEHQLESDENANRLADAIYAGTHISSLDNKRIVLTNGAYDSLMAKGEFGASI